MTSPLISLLRLSHPVDLPPPWPTAPPLTRLPRWLRWKLSQNELIACTSTKPIREIGFKGTCNNIMRWNFLLWEWYFLGNKVLGQLAMRTPHGLSHRLSYSYRFQAINMVLLECPEHIHFASTPLQDSLVQRYP
ncbi:hypothetical protein Syun_025832 [Stephania yunnanensis]|uniref:Uncharacterized protein n=1 Tax=Stephania yunnanensis TaxID=152371 RepID=A0AAP0HV61_9MAGN